MKHAWKLISGLLLQNIWWKLLSLAIAVLIWALVASEPELSTFVTVRALIRQARTRYRWPARPTTRRLK